MRVNHLPPFSLLAAICLSILPGCRTPSRISDPQLTFEVPQADSRPAPSVDPNWWNEFKNSQLSANIIEALTNNPDLQIAAARMQAAGQVAKIEGAARYPTLSLDGGAIKQRQNFIGLPIPGAPGGVLVSKNQSFNLTMLASWELDLWGRLSAANQAAQADAEAASLDLAAAQLSIAGQTALAWIDATTAQMQRNLAKQTLDSYERTKNLVEKRFQRGTRPSIDLRLSKNNVASALASLEQAEIQSQSRIRVLQTLMGAYPDGQMDVANDLPSISPLPNSGVPADLLSRRPDLRAVERRLYATDQRVLEAERNLLPRISLATGGGRVTSEVDDLLNNNFSVWSLAANLSQPLFQGGRLLAGIDLSKAQQKESAAQYVKTALQAFREAETAFRNEDRLKALLTARTSAAEESKAASELAFARYRNGVDTLLTVLESDRRNFLDQSQLIEARAQLLSNRIQLYLALGGGFSPSKAALEETESAPLAAQSFNP